MRSLFTAGSIFALAALATPVMAQTPADIVSVSAPSGVRIGTVVKDAKGVTLGAVERLVGPPGGPPTQVQIRDGSVLRTLPIKGLAPEGGAYMTVLTRAEFQALPPAD